MTVLALETSSRRGGVAVRTPDGRTLVRELDPEARHARDLLPAADALLAEILANSFADETDADNFGPETAQGESTAIRDTWDDLDDYAGWSASPPQRKDGTPLGDLAGWARGVLVSYVDPITLSPSVAATDLIAVVVNVSGPNGVQTTRVSFRSAHAAAGQPSMFTEDVVRHVDLTIQVGVDGPVVTTGTNLWSPALADE